MQLDTRNRDEQASDIISSIYTTESLIAKYRALTKSLFHNIQIKSIA